MELGTEDYYYQEHQYDDAHHEAVMAGDYGDLGAADDGSSDDNGNGSSDPSSPSAKGGGKKKSEGGKGRHAAAAAARAKRRAQAKAAQQASTQQIRLGGTGSGGGSGGPAVTAAALRRQRIAKIQDFSLRYIVRCRLPPPEELEAEELAKEKAKAQREALLNSPFGSFRNEKNGEKAAGAGPSPSTSTTATPAPAAATAADAAATASSANMNRPPLEDRISVEQLELLMLHFYDLSGALDLSALLQREMRSMRLKACETSLSEYVRGQRSEWKLNAAAVNLVRSAARASLQISEDGGLSPNGAAAAAAQHRRRQQQRRREPSASTSTPSLSAATTPRALVPIDAEGGNGATAAVNNNNSSTNTHHHHQHHHHSASSAGGPFLMGGSAANGPSSSSHPFAPLGSDGAGSSQQQNTNTASASHFSVGGSSAATAAFAPTSASPTASPDHRGGGTAPHHLGASTVSTSPSASASPRRIGQQLARLSSTTLLRDRKLLDEAAFTAALQAVLGPSSATAEECSSWFRQIDFENSGVVGWEGFSSFLLSLGEHREHVDSRPFALGIRLQPPSCHPWNRHSGPITCAVVHPTTGALYTGGEDGLIMAWRASTLRHDTLVHRGSSWVVGLCLLHDGRLAAATVEREVLLFDLKAGELVASYKGKGGLSGEAGLSYAFSSGATVAVNEPLVGHLTPRSAKVTSNRAGNKEKHRRLLAGGASHIPMGREEAALIAESARAERRVDAKRIEQSVLLGLEEAPTCMDYHYSAVNQDLIFFGTRGGSVIIYDISDANTRVVRTFHVMAGLHKGRINKIEVLPLLEAIMTCGDDASLKMTSLETGAVLRDYSKAAGGHATGVTSFAFSHSSRVFVSVSSGERRALAWDYLQESPIYALEEHPAPLLAACVSERDRRIMTLSADNTVKISDLVTHKTLQTVTHKQGGGRGGGGGAGGGAGASAAASVSASGDDVTPNFGMMLFDEQRGRHLVLSSFPQAYKLRQSEQTFPPHYSGHVAPVVRLDYSAAHRQLVSFDAESCLTWDCAAGVPKAAYSHTRDVSSGAFVDDGLRLTATGWDESQRRLLCGYHNGSVVVWHHASGQPVNAIHDATIQQAGRYGAEVSALCGTTVGGAAVYVFGVGRRVMYCSESQQFTILRTSSFTLPEAHGAVTALAMLNNHLVSVGTSTGALLVYNLSREEVEGKPMLAADYTDGPPLQLHQSGGGMASTSTSAAASPAFASPQRVGELRASFVGAFASGSATAPLGITGPTPHLVPPSPTSPMGGTTRSRSTSLATAPATPRHNVSGGGGGGGGTTASGRSPLRASSTAAAMRPAIAPSRVEHLFVINKPSPAEGGGSSHHHHLNLHGAFASPPPAAAALASPSSSSPLVLAIHNDGRGALWHAAKRTYVCSLFFSGAGGSAASLFAMDPLTHDTLVYSDALGNISVWDLRYEPVPLMETLRRHTRDPNVAADVRQYIANASETILSMEHASSLRCCFFAGGAQQLTSVVVIPSAYHSSLASQRAAAAGAQRQQQRRAAAEAALAPSAPVGLGLEKSGAFATAASLSMRSPPSSPAPKGGSGGPSAPTQPPSFAGSPESSVMTGRGRAATLRQRQQNAANVNNANNNTNNSAAFAPSSGGGPSSGSPSGAGASVSFNAYDSLHLSPTANLFGSSGRSEHPPMHYQPLIATSALDCSVRLWTIDGACIGVFGVRRWAVERPVSWLTAEAEAPHEGVVLRGAGGGTSGGPRRSTTLLAAFAASAGGAAESSSSTVPPHQQGTDQQRRHLEQYMRLQQQQRGGGGGGGAANALPLLSEEDTLLAALAETPPPPSVGGGDDSIEGLPTSDAPAAMHLAAATAEAGTVSTANASFLPPIVTTPRHQQQQQQAAPTAFHVPLRVLAANKGKQTLSYLAPNSAAVAELLTEPPAGPSYRQQQQHNAARDENSPTMMTGTGDGALHVNAFAEQIPIPALTGGAPRPALEAQQRRTAARAAAVAGNEGQPNHRPLPLNGAAIAQYGGDAFGAGGDAYAQQSSSTGAGGGGGRLRQQRHEGILKPAPPPLSPSAVNGPHSGLGGASTGADSFLDASMGLGMGGNGGSVGPSDLNFSPPSASPRPPQAPSSAAQRRRRQQQLQHAAPIAEISEVGLGELPAQRDCGGTSAGASAAHSRRASTREGFGPGGCSGSDGPLATPSTNRSSGADSRLGLAKAGRRALSAPIAHGGVMGEIAEEDEGEGLNATQGPAPPGKGRRPIFTGTATASPRLGRKRNASNIGNGDASSSLATVGGGESHTAYHHDGDGATVAAPEDSVTMSVAQRRRLREERQQLLLAAAAGAEGAAEAIAAAEAQAQQRQARPNEPHEGIMLDLPFAVSVRRGGDLAPSTPTAAATHQQSSATARGFGWGSSATASIAIPAAPATARTVGAGGVLASSSGASAEKRSQMFLPPPPLSPSLGSFVGPSQPLSVNSPRTAAIDAAMLSGSSSAITHPLTPGRQPPLSPAATPSSGALHRTASSPRGPPPVGANASNSNGIASPLSPQGIAVGAVRAQQGRLARYGLGAAEMREAEARIHAKGAAGGRGRGGTIGGDSGTLGAAAIVEQLRQRRAAQLQQQREEEAAEAEAEGAEKDGSPSSSPTAPHSSTTYPSSHRGGAGGRGGVDPMEAILRLSSQMLIVGVEDVRPPERSYEAQEEARRGGRRVYGVKAVGQSVAPTFSAPNAAGGGGGPRGAVGRK